MKKLILTSLVAFSTVSFAQADTGFNLNYKYENAGTQQIVKNSVEVEVPNLNETFYQVPKMRKTLAVVKLTEAIRTSLMDFANTCDDIKKDPKTPDKPEVVPHNASVRPFPIVRPGLPIIIRPPGPGKDAEFTEKCLTEKTNVVDAFELAIEKFGKEIPIIEADLMSSYIASGISASKAQKLATDIKMQGAVELNLKLVKLMKEVKPRSNHFMLEGVMRMTTASMGLTTGGAQDARKYRDLINSESIPKPSDFVAYGYINEFDLAVAADCDELICTQPKVAYDAENKKLYVQAGFGTNVTMDSFERKPLNLGVLIDISGSMSATDQTKHSRLEWAKEAVQKTLANLVVGEDYLTISTFTNGAEQVWPPKDRKEIAPITQEDKEQILKMIRSIETQGSTNLNAGLELSYETLKQTRKAIGEDADTYEHRTIMVTDANLNYGDPDESGAVSLVEKMSRTRNINLTVIGVGLNFFQDFVNKLTMIRGGNYIFAQNGEDMLGYFNEFDTLVTPAAYNFVADFEIDERKYKLARVHGVPEDVETIEQNNATEEVSPTDNVFDISTIFFVRTNNSGGGARVLEFDILD